MSDWEKIRDTARQLRQKASILEEVADGLERRAEEEGRNHNSFDDDAFINQVRMIYGGFVPGVFKICELTGCSKEQGKRIRGKLIEFFGEGKAETPEALEEERRLLVEDPPYVSFDERPEVKAVVENLTATLTSTLGSIAQALVDEDLERGVRLGRTSN